MSLSGTMNPMYYYLGDGIYWNWDRVQDDELQDVEISREDVERSKADDLASKYEIQMAEEAFSKSFSSSEAYRSYHFFNVLISNMSYIANRYCQYESLSKDYAEVAMQKDVLKDILFVHATDLGINLTLNHIKKLDEIVLDAYNNKNRNSVYNRVGTLQRFIHQCSLDEGKQIDYLDREVMRKLLSLCRLHIAISDVRKKNIDLIKGELIQNNFDSKHNSSVPYVKMLNRKYIQHWKKRHLRSLLHFCPEAERWTLKELINLKQPFDKVAVQRVIFKKYK
ncbi:hypothetical protein JGJ17_003592 [Vibrio alginolyticus]|nr:hypothetical protein [Vibrio alginolyticus]